MGKLSVSIRAGNSIDLIGHIDILPGLLVVS